MTRIQPRRAESALVREPFDNVYGHYKVLRRSTGDFVVHDTSGGPPPWGPVFVREDDARSEAKRLSATASTCGPAAAGQGGGS